MESNTDWLEGKVDNIQAFGLPWGLSSRGGRFDPWVGKIIWRREQQPTPYSCWENLMDRGAWWATVHGVTTITTNTGIYYTSQILCFFLQTEGLRQPCLKQVYGVFFSLAFAHVLSLCHILVNSQNISNFFYYYVCYGDL